MEIGEYLTNVLSVNDLASIQYYYLESPTNNSDSRRRCLSIEATWRQSGALVVTDKEKSGIWVFGKSNSAMSLPPSYITIGPEGVVEVGDTKLEIRKAGTHESSSLWKFPKQTALFSSSQINASSPAISAENNLRNSPALGTKISPSNTAPGINQESITVANPSNGEHTSLERVVESRDIQEHFISAVLATLSYRLCHEGKLIALNARTLVLPISSFSKIPDVFSLAVEKNVCQKRVLMITLDVQLTSLGTLVLKASLDISSDISCLRYPVEFSLAAGPISEGTTLYLAPSGKIARYYGPLKEEEHEQAVPRTEFAKEQYLNADSITSYAIHRWKTRCISWLQKKGIQAELLENCPWIMVEIFTSTASFDRSDTAEGGLWTPEEKLVTIPWPSALCFRRGTYEVLKKTVPNSFRGYDPLEFAEKWFSSKVERDIIIAKRQKERDSAAATLRAQVETDTRNLTSSSHSPIVLRRASNAGAVYPTPPDGIQHVIGATPSFNDSASTPGNVNQQPIHTDQDQVAGSRNEVEDTEGNLWEANTVKRDRISSLDFHDSGNDNFFGDLGGDLFGENDVTDADFNFFDEPDGLEDTTDKISVEENMDDATQEPKAGTISSTYGRSLGHTSNLAAVTDSLMIEVDSGILESQEIKHNPSSDHAVQTNKDLPLEHEARKSLLYDNIPRPPSPPLSPGFIFKRLSTAEVTTECRGSPVMLEKTVSAFGSVEFDSSLSIFNEKYGSRGRFICPPIPNTAARNPSVALPNTGYLRKRRMLRPNAINIVNQSLQSSIELAPEPENNSSQSDSESQSRSPSATPVPDQDDNNMAEDGADVLVPGIKRKRETDDIDEEDEMASSLKDLNMNNSPSIHNADPLDLLDPSLLDWDPADWSLSSFFACPEPRNATSILTDTEYIASAQLLADQAIFRTLKVPMLTNQDETGEGPDNCAYRNSTANLVQKIFAQVVKAIFDQVAECNMITFTEVQDVQHFSQINRLTPRLMPNPRGQHSEVAKQNSTFPLPAPHIEVRRAESRLAVLPSAAPFWENLGLAPCKGSKDVSAICIYPDGEGMSEGVNAFLDHTRSAYESGRFGTHERFCHPDVPDGLFPIDFGESNTLSVADHQALLVRIKETATRVGSLLISGSTEDNIVIYYIYDSTNPELLVPICSAFHDLFTVYKTGLNEENKPVTNELVLQFIPLDFVASHASFVVLRPSEYSRLAMEVYDRCVDLTSGTPSPSIVLEQPLPRSIDFKMTLNPSTSLLQENSCMHIAYAQSIDDRWVTAAWTDNIGSQQMTASYCLGRKGVPLTTSFSDVAHEIWETTLEVIASRKVHWRILVCKCGVMEPSEVDFWKGLASTESNAQISLTLITVDTNPSLNLLPLSVSLPPNALTSQSISYTTPVSTPNASIVSPEQSGNANTPARDLGATNATTPSDSTLELKIEADATLIDIRDQTWGAILSHRLNNSRSLLEFYPALVSGYLIKRTGATISDAPVAMEVNVVHSGANPRVYDALLREILGHYRGLGTLARVRGCVDPVKDCRPWHIAAAEKGVRVLYMLM